MNHPWQLQRAKAQLSALVKSAQREGPQEITVHGQSAAVVLSKKDYLRLMERKPSFIDFIRRSPWVGMSLSLERDKSPIRPVEL